MLIRIFRFIYFFLLSPIALARSGVGKGHQELFIGSTPGMQFLYLVLMSFFIGIVYLCYKKWGEAWVQKLGVKRLSMIFCVLGIIILFIVVGYILYILFKLNI